MTRFEIIVEVNGVKKYLDTQDVESISLNFNIADITEPDKRNSSYSKTIKVPETRNNRAIFGDISDLTIDSQFNPNKKSRCWILADTVVVFEGNIQLKKISMDWRYDSSFYECVIYADNDGFFKELGEEYLNDLDFSELDHIWNEQSIRSSWTASWNDGYFYPLIDYGYDWTLSQINSGLLIGTGGAGYNPGVRIEQMFPATNVKYILDKIFNEVGYTYTSEFLNTSEFKNLYIPYNRENQYKRNMDSLDQRFAVAMSIGIDYFSPYTLFNVIAPREPTNIAIIFNSNTTDSQVLRLIRAQKLPFDDDAAPFGDPYGVFDEGSYEFQAPPNPRDMRFSVQFDIRFPFPTYLDPEGNNPSQSFEDPPGSGIFEYTGIEIRRSMDENGNTIPGGVPVYVNGSTARVAFLEYQIPNIQYLEIEKVRCPRDGAVDDYPYVYDELNLPKRVRGTITTDLFGLDQINYKLRTGERVWAEFYFSTKACLFRYQVFRYEFPSVPINDITPGDLLFSTQAGNGIGTFNGVPIPTPIRISNTFIPDPFSIPWGNTFFNAQLAVVENDNGVMFNNLSEIYGVGELIPYNLSIPLNIKKKDFISSLVKLFNLYIEPDKENSKNLIIDPRDIYYEKGDIKDWTSKLDTNSNVEELILAETQNREIQFKYKDDKDFYNEDYRSRKNGVSYGEFSLFTDNDFTKGIRKIEPIFSPTPMVPLTGSDAIIIPKIGKLNNNVFSSTDHSVRILTKYSRINSKSWNWDEYDRSNTLRNNGFLRITTQFGTQVPHNYVIGDLILINTNDGGVIFPELENRFAVVLEVPNIYTIIIDYYPIIIPVTIISGTSKTIDGLLPISHRNNTLRFEGNMLNFYPYLGHLDDPINSRFDLNFGQSTTYYPYESLTNNNLYTLFYKNMFDDIISKDSKIVNAKFYLTARDISDFKFSDKIYIKNQYFKVNKITNYDPTKEGLTNVELIKSGIENVVITRIGNTRPVTSPIEVPGDALDIDERNGLPFLIAMSNPSNNIRENNSIVNGMNNDVYSSNSIVIGNDNRVSGFNNFIFGNDNAVENSTRSNFIVGSRNQIGPGVGGGMVFGDDTKVINSNTIQINQKFIVTSNYISAGRDEILNMYFDNKPINYISASFNVVREFGSQDPVNFILSGRDSI